MSILKRIIALAAVLFVVLGIYGGVLIAVSEIGKEVVVLHRWEPDAEPHKARLWIVDHDGYPWIHHGGASEPWIVHLADDPVISLERGGELRRYRATPVPGMHATIHRLMREKYGVADRMIRFWFGTDTESGLATGGGPCGAPPIRLEPLGA